MHCKKGQRYDAHERRCVASIRVGDAVTVSPKYSPKDKWVGVVENKRKATHSYQITFADGRTQWLTQRYYRITRRER